MVAYRVGMGHTFLFSDTVYNDDIVIVVVTSGHALLRACVYNCVFVNLLRYLFITIFVC